MGKTTEETKPKKKSTMLSRAQTAKLVLALERLQGVPTATFLAGRLSEIVIARAEGRGLGTTVDGVLHQLLAEFVPEAVDVVVEG